MPVWEASRGAPVVSRASRHLGGSRSDRRAGSRIWAVSNPRAADQCRPRCGRADRRTNSWVRPGSGRPSPLSQPREPGVDPEEAISVGWIRSWRPRPLASISSLSGRRYDRRAPHFFGGRRRMGVVFFQASAARPHSSSYVLNNLAVWAREVVVKIGVASLTPAGT